ncbi:hypothetical protein BJ165DRAFT_669154 [Panaeolus papilionaceus]|nr:hypothetical protein BJ165DRAFT_669154 [Panaeolus papilionaceus]
MPTGTFPYPTPTITNAPAVYLLSSSRLLPPSPLLIPPLPVTKHNSSKSWGTPITPSAPSPARDIHVGALHPRCDLGTVDQAVALFPSTGARCFSIHGQARTVCLVESGFVRGGGGKHRMTDPAHNDKKPPSPPLSKSTSGNTESSRDAASKCAFIQFHGKGQRTCVEDDVFISTN